MELRVEYGGNTISSQHVGRVECGENTTSDTWDRWHRGTITVGLSTGSEYLRPLFWSRRHCSGVSQPVFRALRCILESLSMTTWSLNHNFAVSKPLFWRIPAGTLKYRYLSLSFGL